MVHESFTLTVLCSFLTVFDPNLERPLNDWTPKHVEQGFSWRPGSVSFGTLESGGVHRVEVWTSEHIDLSEHTERAIGVPFSVPPSARVEVASVPEGRVLHIPPGEYRLVYEIGYDNAVPWCRLTFTSGGQTEAEILRADEQLVPMYPLLMEAEPAG